MKFTKRNLVILLWLAAIGVILLLAVSTPLVEFESGKMLQPQLPETTGGAQIPSDSEVIITILRGVMVLILLSVPAYILMNIFTPKGRRRLLALFFAWVMVFLCLLGFNSMMQALPTAEPTPTPTVSKLEPPPMENLQPDLEEITPINLSIPPAVDYTICAVLAVIVATGAAYAAWRYGRGRSKVLQLQELAAEAAYAIEEIEAGADARATIIRCYSQMSQVVAKRRGIRRSEGMTAQEFVQVLEGLGLPGAPTLRLTHLFENARYSKDTLGTRDQLEAIDALKAIAEACKQAQ